MATHCNFGGYLDQVLRDRLVCGIRHKNTQKRLLSEANFSLQKAIEVACNIEAAEAQTSQSKGENNAPVMAVEHMKRGNGTWPETPPDECGKCTRCGGGNHKVKDCRHKSAKCYKCHKTGHLSSVCRSTTANLSKRNSQHVRWVDEPHDRTLTLTVPFFRFQGNLLTRLQWN